MRRNSAAGILAGALLAIGLAASGVPAGAQPDPRYYDYDEVLALFDTWAADYPDIFHREVIGYTLIEEEPIWACKISDNAAVHEPEARVFLHAAQHANEANGTNAIVFMIDRMLSRYGQQSYYTNMVDNLETWFVPVVNVDGHRMVFAGGPNWDWWRKTKRDNDHNDQYTFPEDGVDANRNWDYRWAEYDSTDYWSSRYKGPYPFSEPEVVAVRDFILRERPVFVLDMHSPDVPSIGNKIWWPWYERDEGHYGPDDDIYRPICINLGNRTETETNGVYYNGNGAAYNEVPKEQCWIYANTQICIYLMEISRQFWWTGATVDTIAHRVGRGCFYLLERAQAGPGLRGTTTDAVTGAPLEAEIRIAQVYDPEIGPFMSEQFHGAYYRLLNNGSYNVSVFAEDHDPAYANVYVSASGWTVRDFQLQPDPAAAPERDLAHTRLLWADTPLRPGRAVHFRLERPARVSLDLLDVSGRRVTSLLRGDYGAGVRSVPLRRGIDAGSYLLLLRSGGRQVSNKVVIVD
ncbi:MAG: hypothetical protein GF330_03095 [Candidatus Eisenbacteria bacterium]|nr:hypothetical protein [Candidatus Eisenbacteria bacterium]